MAHLTKGWEASFIEVKFRATNNEECVVTTLIYITKTGN
jgi:hypothetical protein